MDGRCEKADRPPRATHRLLLNTPGLNPRCATKVRSPAAWMLLCGCRLPELACSTARVDLGHELAGHRKDEELGQTGDGDGDFSLRPLSAAALYREFVCFRNYRLRSRSGSPA